jgi:hypothetical protein
MVGFRGSTQEKSPFRDISFRVNFDVPEAKRFVLLCAAGRRTPIGTDVRGLLGFATVSRRFARQLRNLLHR